MPDKWMTLAAAAAALNVHPRTIERRIASQKIQSRRTDDGQLQVLINVPDMPDTSPDPLETVKELAQDQVTLATGSASALVKFAQDDALRARQEIEVVRQDAGRARRDAKTAWTAVACMACATCVAVGWTTHKMTRSSEQLKYLDQQAAQVRIEAQKLMLERDAAVSQAQTARIAQARSDGQLAAYIEKVSLNRPTTQPTTAIGRVVSLFLDK
jgi:hypothetical protein